MNDLPAPKTKIVATIGPACSAMKPLRTVIEAGIDVCRLNFSHGNHEGHLEVLNRIRQIEAEIGRPIAVLQDLCGPKIRTTELPGGAIDLIEGQRVKVVAGLAESTDPNVIGASLESLTTHAEPGHRILLDDGLIELKMLEVDHGNLTVECEVVYGGLLKKRKGINLPDTRLDVPSMTPKDHRDLLWGLENNVDYIALSFVRHEDDVLQLRKAAEGLDSPPKLIAKIEKPEAVERLEQIVKAFDGVMVARGDLSVETPLWNVPALQKEIIRQANLHDRISITATQMLDSMQDRPRPTRAEVSDVANAIYDGTDAIMLSGETASGHYPVESVEVMRRIAQAADGHADRQYGSRRHESLVNVDTFCDSICGGAIATAKELNPCCIVTFTSTGKTALYMSKYHPTVPVVGATTDPRTYRRMALYRGVMPIQVEVNERSENLVHQVEAEIRRLGLGEPGDIVIYVGGTNLGTKGNINSLKVRRLAAE
ncbi:MAG: pyruvate kinase [Planctomycetes bacterium]|nr:pyruvate kinase [Planctomycetota bacterium]